MAVYWVNGNAVINREGNYFYEVSEEIMNSAGSNDGDCSGRRCRKDQDQVGVNHE